MTNPPLRRTAEHLQRLKLLRVQERLDPPSKGRVRRRSPMPTSAQSWTDSQRTSAGSATMRSQ